ncbi:co-chaperone DjlA [Psychrosphaera haliotis]|nr:co-chaperone DjlA [Psychrosphaera haliotis]
MIGKIAGALFGFLLVRHFLGALAGLWIGHLFDKALQRMNDKGNVEEWLISNDAKQSIFFYTTFSVMGHVAKASGRVTPEHIKTANDFMDQMRLNEQQVAEAKDAFREGKLLGFPLKKKIKQFKNHFGNRRDLCQFFLEIQIQTAYSDSILEADEYNLLVNIAKQLGFNKRNLTQLIAMWEAEMRFQNYKQQQQEKYKQYDRKGSSSQEAKAPSLLDAYAVIGVSDRDSVRDIKRAYKRLMSQNHPDKLVAKGLPPEMMEVAKQKTQDIQSAYEIIKKARDF